MRQYRAIPIDGKDFVYGWYAKRCYAIGSTGPDIVTDVIIELDSLIPEEVIPETVGQEIDIDIKGLRDFDTKFWEGDIIECQHGHRGVIEYDNHYEGGGQYWFGSEFECDICMDKERWYYYKVIGDIHTTPNLMEAKDE